MSGTIHSSDFDFIVVGGGTNGLVAASYLAKEGFSVLVVERQDYFGGGAITQELTLPGFQHDTLATSINLWKAGTVQNDLELEKYGFSEASPDPVASTPFKSGKAISIYRDLNITLKTISQFSVKDAEAFKKIFELYTSSKEILLGSLSSAPLSFSSMMSTLEETDEGLDFLQFSYMSSRDWLEENFESEEVKAFMALWGSNHVPLSPEDAGGAILVLVFIGILQDMGVGVPIGGMKTLVGSLCNYLQTHNCTLVGGLAVKEIVVKDSRAVGIRTVDGRSFSAKKGVLCNVDPKQLFLKLIDESNIPKEFRRKVDRYRYSKVSQVMIHAALDEWLDYRPRDLSNSGMVQIGDSLDQISKAYNACVVGEMPAEPFMTIDNTTGYDSSRTPAGKHTLWNFVRAPVYLKGRPWSDEAKEEFADVCIERLAQYAPNAKKAILKRVVLSPQNIETIAPSIINADPGGGKATIDQSLALRPFPHFSQYKTPIRRLYLCGPAAHPGGGVSGLPGRNAALTAIEESREMT